MAASKLPSCFSGLCGWGTAVVAASGSAAVDISEVPGFVIRLVVLEAELFFVSGMIASPVLARRAI
jgi:hypothetical protein